MFNGYGDQVASLYSGMDLRKKLLMKPLPEKFLRRIESAGVSPLPGARLVLTWKGYSRRPGRESY